MAEANKVEVQPSLNAEQEVDYQKVLAAKDQVIAQLSEDRDNYRTGMIKAKKLNKELSADNSFSDENAISKDDIASLVQEQVQEQLISLKIKEAMDEKNKIISEMATKLSEAKLALKNKPTVSVTAGGSNQDKPEVESNFFTQEQIAELKRRNPNIDINKVIENMKASK